jgi:hypothetical protein
VRLIPTPSFGKDANQVMSSNAGIRVPEGLGVLEYLGSGPTRPGFDVGRLPVIDGHKLVGMPSQADLATNLSSNQVAKLLEAISEAP